MTFIESCGYNMSQKEVMFSTVKGQKYFHNVRNSIYLRVFSCLQEKLSCLSWSTYFHDFGAI